jgi:hypothetical protein
VAEDAQGETSSEGLPPISADPDQEFTDGEKEELVRALGYVPSENIHSPGDNDLTGKITPQVINVAYKFLLNELGINYKQGIKLSDLEAESEPSELQTMVMSPIIDAPINEEEVNQRTTNSAEFLDSDIINLQGKGFEFKFYPRVYVPGKKLSFTNTRPMTAEEWTTHGPDGSNKATFVNLRPGILSDDLVNDFQFSINELNTKVFSTDKGMGLIEGEPMVFCRIPEDTPYVFDIEDQTMFHEGSGNDDEYLEITAPGTTTLRAVVADAMRQHEELHEDVPPMKIGDETVKAPSTNRTDKGSVEIRVGEHPTDFFATLNTATTPSIEAALMGLVNGLNKIVIGTTKKIWTFTIHQSLLSPLQREAFLDVLKQSPSTESLFDVETAVDNIKDTVLLITDDEAIDAKYGTFFTKAIYSFPEVTTSPSQGAQGENTEARAVWLRYGEADSIVTDITFKSDIRYLSQMAQANYTVRQYNDIKGLFDSKIKWEGVINYVVGEGLASKLADLKKKQSNFESEDETTPFDEEILKIENITKRTKVQSAEPADQQLQDGEVDSLVLDYFPNALKEMLVDVGVDQTILRVKDTSVSLESLQKIAAVVQDKEALEVFFPFADIDKATNIQTKHSYYVGDSGGLNVKVSENIVLARRINYDFTQSIGGDSWKKDLDTKLSYVMAMQRQAWEVDAVFLGIPEMDNPPVEMTQRRIYLVVKDERIPGAYHWLSGVYRVIKVSHSIDPSKGYLTKISLRKDVVLSSNFSSYIENGSVK